MPGLVLRLPLNPRCASGFEPFPAFVIFDRSSARTERFVLNVAPRPKPDNDCCKVGGWLRTGAAALPNRLMLRLARWVCGPTLLVPAIRLFTRPEAEAVGSRGKPWPPSLAIPAIRTSDAWHTAQPSRPPSAVAKRTLRHADARLPLPRVALSGAFLRMFPFRGGASIKNCCSKISICQLQ